MVNEALTFRREQMPCDVIGLEPGWMSKNYDGTTAKAWHPERFPIPSWAPKGPHTFFGALERKGFQLSLWLCCDYDLGVYEELKLAAAKATSAAGMKTAAGATVNVQEGFSDGRLSKPAGTAAGTKGAPQQARPEGVESWFEHLKKFVDQGAAAFKLDGSSQVIEHPTRPWGDGMTDEEMHNLYPAVLITLDLCTIRAPEAKGCIRTIAALFGRARMSIGDLRELRYVSWTAPLCVAETM